MRVVVIDADSASIFEQNIHPSVAGICAILGTSNFSQIFLWDDFVVLYNPDCIEKARSSKLTIIAETFFIPGRSILLKQNERSFREIIDPVDDIQNIVRFL